MATIERVHTSGGALVVEKGAGVPVFCTSGATRKSDARSSALSGPRGSPAAATRRPLHPDGRDVLAERPSGRLLRHDRAACCGAEARRSIAAGSSRSPTGGPGHAPTRILVRPPSKTWGDRACSRIRRPRAALRTMNRVSPYEQPCAARAGYANRPPRRRPSPARVKEANASACA